MAKPHSRKKAEARDLAALDPDAAWADTLFEKMLAACHPFQRDAVMDPGKRVSMLAGRGGGKTTALRVRAKRKTTTRKRARVAYVATSRPEAERLNWEPLKQLLDQLGEMDNFEFHESKMICTCRRTGGTYQFFGADDKREVNKLRGQPFDEFQVDEAASFDTTLMENMIDQAVGPRLGERGGCIVLAGTPGFILYGTFYDATHDGSEFHRPYSQRNKAEWKGFKGWSSHAWDLFDVVELKDAKKKYPAMQLNYNEALETKARKKWGDDNPVWLREYRRRWARDNTTTMYNYRAKLDDGSTWNQWDPLGWSAAHWAEYAAMEFDQQRLKANEMMRTAISKLPEDFTDYLFGFGMDLGSRDPHSVNVLAFSPSDPQRRKWHVCTFDRRGMYARLIAELLIGPEATEMARQGKVYLREHWGGLIGASDWPTAAVADLAALGEAVIKELADYGIKFEAAEKKDKLSNIEVTNGDFHDGMLFILAGSELEKQVSTLQWKPDENGIPKEDKAARNDHADSLIYIRRKIGNMFAAPPPKKESKEAPEERKKAKAPPPKPAPDPYLDRKPKGEFDSLLADSFDGLL
jgi:hypothetical protein